MINNNFSFNNKFDRKILNKKRSLKLLKKYAKVDKEIKKEINLKKTLKSLVFLDRIHILQLSVRTRMFVHIHLTDSKVK